MPAPTTQTEAGLATYCHLQMGGFATLLSYTVDGGSYQPVIDAALAEYGVEEITEVSGLYAVRLLHACARLCLWRQVTQVSNVQFGISDAGSTVDLQQLNDHARASCKEAIEDVKRARSDLAYQVALAAGDTVARQYRIHRDEDPYQEDLIDSDELSSS